MNPSDPVAWLETATGDRLPLDGGGSLGRSQTRNRHAFTHDRVSRRHALIHAQEGGEFWIVDLGSANGTHIGGERIVVPTRLNDGDRLDLGRAVELVFRQPVLSDDFSNFSEMCHTVAETHVEMRWLLITDLSDSTLLSKTMPPAQLAERVGHWLNDGTELLASNGGRINKYLGDGFLGFWRDQRRSAEDVARAIDGFRKLLAKGGLSFRVVVHRGEVAIGGAPTLGEENLYSDDLNLAFRLEKVASAMEIPFVFSEPAAELLAPHIALKAIPGTHKVKGFESIERLSTLA